jgi:hypothetical protein
MGINHGLDLTNLHDGAAQSTVHPLFSRLYPLTGRPQGHDLMASHGVPPMLPPGLSHRMGRFTAILVTHPGKVACTITSTAPMFAEEGAPERT